RYRLGSLQEDRRAARRRNLGRLETRRRVDLLAHDSENRRCKCGVQRQLAPGLNAYGGWDLRSLGPSICCRAAVSEYAVIELLDSSVSTPKVIALVFAANLILVCRIVCGLTR